jgi:hypothetical protein
MKKMLGVDVSGNYTFNPGAKTVTFSGLPKAITLSNILLITNVTRNTIIYNFADTATGAVSFNNNVLTLTYNTGSHSASDVLQIFLDVESYEESLHDLLRRMNKLLESNATVDLYQRQRVVIDAIGNTRGTPTEVGTTVPISGTVTATVSNQLASQNAPASAVNPYSYSSQTVGLIMEGPVHQVWRIIDDSRSAYANAIRSKLTFS